ncbi:hypothetical protein F4778DRAFT_754540 [Xylariomycetidae sp. FL2044]|nr:hypothetical protein F4778DRAFT_754540 [Xylariomycetidae sp. FL2044]
MIQGTTCESLTLQLRTWVACGWLFRSTHAARQMASPRESLMRDLDQHTYHGPSDLITKPKILAIKSHCSCFILGMD